MRAADEKIGKPKYSTVKIHLLGGISLKGLTPLVMFKKTIKSVDFQCYVSLSVIPFIREKMPYGHRLLIIFS